MSATPAIAIMGVFVADVSFAAERLPNMGETLMGDTFASGPGGKGSNQAVAAARAGASVAFIGKIGADTFGNMARDTWREAGVTDRTLSSELPTGAAMIYINSKSRDNAIILVPSAGGTLSPADVEEAKDTITGAKVFVTQLEQPADSALRALQLAKEAGVITVFNPAPAPGPIDDAYFPLCDYITPNEAEAEGLTGIKVDSVATAKEASDYLLAKGVGTALLTLGERGALLHNKELSELVPPPNAGMVVETTGAGDAFNGGFAAALAEDQAPLDAVRFACTTAAISVTRPGTAPSMPPRAEIDALLSKG